MDTTSQAGVVTADGLGARLRQRRQDVGLTLRELSRRIGMSPSLVSQIETGKVQPSVPTLYALVNELGGSFDALLFGEPSDSNNGGAQVPRSASAASAGTRHIWEEPRSASAGTRHIWEVPRSASAASAGTRHIWEEPLVQRAHDRKTLQLGGGVRWERLTQESVPGVEFLFVEYQPGAESGGPGEYQRHSGREWCYVVSGRLDIVVGFDDYVLEAGDAITFDAATPHRLCNSGDEPAVSVWFQLQA